MVSNERESHPLMTKRIPEPTKPPRERAFLVGVEFHKRRKYPDSLEDSLEELGNARLHRWAWKLLVKLPSAVIVPIPETLIGSGKVSEIKILVEETLTQVVVFDNELIAASSCVNWKKNSAAMFASSTAPPSSSIFLPNTPRPAKASSRFSLPSTNIFSPA